MPIGALLLTARHLLSLIVCAMYKALFKWLATKLTGRCELLRILDGQPQGAKRTASVEFCLQRSNKPELRAASQLHEAVLSKEGVLALIAEIARTKDVKAEVHDRFEDDLLRCLFQLLGYQRLLREVEALRRQRFDAKLPAHVALLQELWAGLEPQAAFPGVRSEQWMSVGFQSDEPYTDFRGMGLLSLHNLVYLTATYPELARRLLALSRHPTEGYSLAIVSINLTDLAVRLMRQGRLKHHFYNLVQGAPKMEHFHDVYCWILVHFDEFWRAQGPVDVMMFNPVKDRFLVWLQARLRHKDCLLRPAFSR